VLIYEEFYLYVLQLIIESLGLELFFISSINEKFEFLNNSILFKPESDKKLLFTKGVVSLRIDRLASNLELKGRVKD
jgi:hypothetical protein